MALVILEDLGHQVCTSIGISHANARDKILRLHVKMQV